MNKLTRIKLSSIYKDNNTKSNYSNRAIAEIKIIKDLIKDNKKQ